MNARNRMSRFGFVVFSVVALFTTSAKANVDQARMAKAKAKMDLTIKNPFNIPFVSAIVPYRKSSFEVNFSSDGGTACEIREETGFVAPCTLHTFTLDRVFSNYATAVRISVRVSDLFALFTQADPRLSSKSYALIDRAGKKHMNEVVSAGGDAWTELNFIKNADAETVLGAVKLEKNVSQLMRSKSGLIIRPSF